MVDIAIHVSDGFPMLSLALMVEPLRVANRERAGPTFQWRIVADEAGPVAASSGLTVEAEPLPAKVPDAAIVLASYRPEHAATTSTLAWLRRNDRMGALIGCVDTGALVLARAGLLRRRPAAAHPEAIAGFRQQFPDSLFFDRLHDFSPPRFSSAGGVATMDMTLAMITHFENAQAARNVATVLTYTGSQADPNTAESEGAPEDPVLVDAQAIMAASLDQPIPISLIAHRCGVPGWRLTRLFRRRLHTSPTSHYVGLRLARAREMLRNSTLRLGDIASACGYDNVDVFSRAYKLRFGRAPSRDRVL